MSTIKTVGITGGIASGKTTVAHFLSDMGVPVFEADRLSREVMEPGLPAYNEIVNLWPQVIVEQSPSAGQTKIIDRSALGRIVFAETDQRKKLTSIVVPRITELFIERRKILAQHGHKICALEAAILFEENLECLADGVLLVSLPAKEQVLRLMERNHLAEKEAQARLAAQLSLEEKVKRSQWVIENNGTREELKVKTRETWQQICSILVDQPE